MPFYTFRCLLILFILQFYFYLPIIISFTVLRALSKETFLLKKLIYRNITLCILYTKRYQLINIIRYV